MDTEAWNKAATFHGHTCPGLAIGFRAVEAAVEKLGIGSSEDEEIVCVTENDACGVDAVQALLSCTIGKGNLIYRPTGKQAFTFFNRNNGDSVRVYLIARNTEDISREEWQKTLLSLPLDEVFAYSQPSFELPTKARLFKTVICEECGEGAPEHLMHLQEGKVVCSDCFEAYHRGWF